MGPGWTGPTCCRMMGAVCYGMGCLTLYLLPCSARELGRSTKICTMGLGQADLARCYYMWLATEVG